MHRKTTTRHGWAILLAMLVAQASISAEAAAQPTNTANRGPITVARFHGAWELVTWTSRDASGAVTYPYGEGAEGQITYTSDGRMSAHLMRPPADPSDAPSQHIAYWGRYTLQAADGTVTHQVIGADLPGWIGSDQVRRFRFDGTSTLILSLGQQDLTWRRVGGRP